MTDTETNERLQSRAMELRVLLSVIFKVAHQSMEKRLAQHASEMSKLQFSIIMMVAHQGSQTISELSRKIGVDPSTLVPSVDALERKKLIIRQRDTNDRRRIPLSMGGSRRFPGSSRVPCRCRNRRRRFMSGACPPRRCVARCDANC